MERRHPKQLPGQMALEVSYVGNHSSHQFQQPDFNHVSQPRNNKFQHQLQHLRRYPNIGEHFRNLYLGLRELSRDDCEAREKRLTAGLQFVTSYTFGHALSNSGTTLSGSSGGSYWKDPTNFATFYSNASWDIRHNLTTGFNYDLPFGRGKQYGAN